MSRRLLRPLLASLTLPLFGCAIPETPAPTTPDPGPSLSERLGAGEARAGRLTASNPEATFGGISAEARAGDWKLINDRVQFVVQGLRPGHFYFHSPGGIVDADIVRGEGAQGFDLLDEHAVMAGLGRTFVASDFVLLGDGTQGEPASVRASGVDGLVGLFAGALESDGLFPGLDLEIVTDYTLEPDSWFLRIDTTFTNVGGDPVRFSPGDLLLPSADASTPWHHDVGSQTMPATPRAFVAGVGRANEQAMMLFAGNDFDPTLGAPISGFIEAIVGFAEPVEVPAGSSVGLTRWLGVGPDLATLEAERRRRLGLASSHVVGRVEVGGEPVPGARVQAIGDSGPWTVAFADEDGAYELSLPPGGWELVATADEDGIFVDLPESAGFYSPYATGHAKAAALSSLAGETAVRPPRARGFAPGAQVPLALAVDEERPVDLALPPRGWLDLRVLDGEGEGSPARVEVLFVGPDPTPPDDRFGNDNPGGREALVFVADGVMSVPVEPGTYRVRASRGVRHEGDEVEVVVGDDERVEVELLLPRSTPVDGWVHVDPHVHGAPSADGGIPMSERMVVMAAVGMDVHVSTDHDHIVDYGPVNEALGLDGLLGTIVGVESSPVLRGHFNVYPLQERAGSSNNGAVIWWDDYEQPTDTLLARLEQLAGTGGIVQANHPTESSGLFAAAGLTPGSGVVGRPYHWSERFAAVEVNNAGQWQDTVPHVFDLASRGHRSAWVGVSDSHTHDGGRVGQIHTRVFLGDEPVTSAAVGAAMRAGHTIASSGPALVVQGRGAAGPGLPGDTLTGPTLSIEASVHAPSWMPAERLQLWENGVMVEEIELDPAPEEGSLRGEVEFQRTPAADAWYAVMVSSADRANRGIPGLEGWALSTPIRLDLAGDGWQAPLAPLDLD